MLVVAGWERKDEQEGEGVRVWERDRCDEIMTSYTCYRCDEIMTSYKMYRQPGAPLRLRLSLAAFARASLSSSTPELPLPYDETSLPHSCDCEDIEHDTNSLERLHPPPTPRTDASDTRHSSSPSLSLTHTRARAHTHTYSDTHAHTHGFHTHSRSLFSAAALHMSE